MSKKKPAKIPHRIPMDWRDFRSDPIDERYAAEVERDTNRLAKRYEQAQKRLESAQRKAERVASTTKQASRIKAAWAEVEQRLAELREVERLMQPDNTASRSHQGRRSIRPAHRGTPMRKTR